MSRADRDEPLRWHWLYIPLVAYLVFSIAPSILAPIFFVVTLFIIDVPMQPAPTPVSLVAFPLFLGLIFWPFLLMYRYARNALIEHPSSEKSLRLATIMSVAAMSWAHRLIGPDSSRLNPLDLMLHFRLFPVPGDRRRAGSYTGISTARPSANTTVSSSGFDKWARNSRSSSGVTLSRFAIRSG